MVMLMNFLKKIILKLKKKNKHLNFYVDLNVLYAFFDWLSPNNVSKNKEDILKRLNSIVYFLHDKKNKNVRFVISRSVYIEWFQKIIDCEWDKEQFKTFNQFCKSDNFKKIIEKFRELNLKIFQKKTLFEFEWKTKTKFGTPKKQSWDFFHVNMREFEYKILTFDKKMKKDFKDSIELLKK